MARGGERVERSSGAAPPRPPGGSSADDQRHELLRIESGLGTEGVAIVGLAGELDLSTIPKLEEPLLNALDSSSVVLDLTRLAFIDSSGIGLLIRVHQTANGTRAFQTVVAEGSQVARVFALAGIDHALPVFVDRDEAIAAAANADD
jgi:anti-sigma B factor antagonist